MRELTTREKRNAYNYAIRELKKSYSKNRFVCLILDCWLEKKFKGEALLDSQNYFPEFLAQKPKNKRSDGAWFPMGDAEIRIKVLQNAKKLLK